MLDMCVQVYNLLFISIENLFRLKECKEVDFFDGFKIVPSSDRENRRIYQFHKILFDFLFPLLDVTSSLSFSKQCQLEFLDFFFRRWVGFFFNHRKSERRSTKFKYDTWNGFECFLKTYLKSRKCLELMSKRSRSQFFRRDHLQSSKWYCKTICEKNKNVIDKSCHLNSTEKVTNNFKIKTYGFLFEIIHSEREMYFYSDTCFWRHPRKRRNMI